MKDGAEKLSVDIVAAEEKRRRTGSQKRNETSKSKVNFREKIKLKALKENKCGLDLKEISLAAHFVQCPLKGRQFQCSFIFRILFLRELFALILHDGQFLL